MPVLHSERCDEMKETEIRTYAKLMKELELTGLEITEEHQKLRLERSFPVGTEMTLSGIPAVVSEPKESKQEADYVSVTSPLVGVFYAAPAENAAPYVAIGDSVKKGQVLCLVEAMKLMNEILAEEDGVLSEICVTNGQVVEYGTELFRIKR